MGQFLLVSCCSVDYELSSFVVLCKAIWVTYYNLRCATTICARKSWSVVIFLEMMRWDITPVSSFGASRLDTLSSRARSSTISWSIYWRDSFQYILESEPTFGHSRVLPNRWLFRCARDSTHRQAASLLSTVRGKIANSTLAHSHTARKPWRVFHHQDIEYDSSRWKRIRVVRL